MKLKRNKVQPYSAWSFLGNVFGLFFLLLKMNQTHLKKDIGIDFTLQVFFYSIHPKVWIRSIAILELGRLILFKAREQYLIPYSSILYHIALETTMVKNRSKQKSKVNFFKFFFNS